MGMQYCVVWQFNTLMKHIVSIIRTGYGASTRLDRTTSQETVNVIVTAVRP
jgi:hypothetical protein